MERVSLMLTHSYDQVYGNLKPASRSTAGTTQIPTVVYLWVIKVQQPRFHITHLVATSPQLWQMNLVEKASIFFC